jgi:hypothetical protein
MKATPFALAHRTKIMVDPEAPDIARLYQACNPHEALEPEDVRYVNFDEARGGNILDEIVRSLRWAARPDCKLFAGHRGIGKTSELKRLQQRLEKPEGNAKPFFVAFIDVLRQLDANDLDFPDLLVLLAGEVQQKLRDANIEGFSATSSYLSRLWEDLKELLGSEVRLKSAEVEVPFGSLALELRNRPSQRATLREKIEALATDLLEAVNQLLDEANAALRKGGRAGLVLIIDGLDKISRRPLDKGGNTHDRLFVERSEQMTSLRAHTIYTIPISMYYSPRCAILEQAFGEFNKPFSMIRIRGEGHAEPTPETPGMQKLWELLDLRCKYANVEFGKAFDADETWQYLCRMSGGHPRHVLILLTGAASQQDELPITRRSVEQAVRTYANSLLREIPDAFWGKLRPFDRPQDEFPKDDDHQEMLFLLHVFEYMNGRPWYEVNPVLRTLERFQK